MNSTPLNFGWQWFRDPVGDACDLVDLPHSTTDLPLNNFSETEFHFVSRYRKILPPDALRPGLRTLIHFEGVMARAEVRVGPASASVGPLTLVGEHLGGYTPFTFDLTDQLVAGQENVVEVLVDGHEDKRIPPFGYVVDYLTFAGIYREVQLEWVEPFHLVDTFVKTLDVLPGTPELQPHLEVELNFVGPLSGELARPRAVDLVLTLSKGSEVVLTRPFHFEFGSGAGQVAVCALYPEGVQLWSPETPALYQLKVEGVSARPHAAQVTFGFREARFTPEGFLLNGKPLKLRGLNRHQAWPHVGYAMPRSAQARDADLLKFELGVNLVRTSHYPQSRHFLDRCDEIGLLVFEEIPGWQHIGDLAWQEQSLQDVRDMIVRDRNRPSVILWGVRINESPDSDEFYRRTNALAHQLDPTRQTGGVRNFEKSALFEDVYTYNDFVHKGTNQALLDPKKVLPRKAPFLVTEHNGHMFPTKSFDTESRRIEHALRHLRVLQAAYAHPQRSGAIGWCAFDYNTHRDFGSGDHICYHGVSDIFRLPKLAAAAYASQQSEVPVLELATAMIPGDRDGGMLGQVLAFTNADRVRLSLNGEVLAEFLPDRKNWPDLPHPPVVIDDFVGEQLVTKEGLTPLASRMLKRLFRAIVRHGDKALPLTAQLRAGFLMLHGFSLPRLTALFVRYVGQWGQTSLVYTFEALQNGEVVARTDKGPSQSARLEVKADATHLVERETYDVTRVVLRHLDTHEQVLTYSSEVVTLTLTGPGEILGPTTVALIGGVCAVWVRTRAADLGAGTRHLLALTASGVQTGTQSLTLNVRKEKP
ncbi:MAG: glycoside hydrolase family 2 TIM barrel-domain containing protein [Spirochaetales bacterium]